MYLVPALAGLFASYVGLLALAAFLLMTYLMWKSIKGPGARTTAGRSVLFQFIPGYGLYWMFHVYPGFATDYNSHVKTVEALSGKQAPRLSRGLMIARCVFFMLTISVASTASQPIYQQGNQWGAWLVVLLVGVVAVVIDAIVISKVCDAVNWLADASIAPASVPASPTSASVGGGAVRADTAIKHTRLGIASALLALLMLGTFVVMLASRDPASGTGADLSFASLSTLNGAFTLLTVLLGVAASVLAIAGFGRRNTRKVFASVGLGGSLVLLTVTAALMTPLDQGLAYWIETSPNMRKSVNYPRLFPIVENGNWGFIDVTGRVVIEPQFDYARQFSEGLGAVNVGGVCTGGEVQGGKWAFVDTTGAFVVNPQYSMAYDFSEGLARADDGLTCTFVNIRGQRAFTVSPNPLLLPAESVRVVVGLIMAGEFTEGYVSFAQGKSVGFLNRAGRMTVAPRFTVVGEFSEGLAAAQLGQYPSGKWGYIDTRGRWVISPQFDAAGPFSEGLAAVEVGATNNDSARVRPGKWGYIDNRGRFVINPQFDNADKYAEGLARVCVDGKLERFRSLVWISGGKYGFIDHQGNSAIPPQYAKAGDFCYGRAAADSGGLEGYVNKNGAFLVPPRFRIALSYRDGVAIVVEPSPAHGTNPFDDLSLYDPDGPGPPTPRIGPWAYIDTTGRYIWKSTDWPPDSAP